MSESTDNISYREASRKNYGSSPDKIKNCDIELGTLMRIADALELLTQNRMKIMRENKALTAKLESANSNITHLKFEINGLRGALTARKKSIIKK